MGWNFKYRKWTVCGSYLYHNEVHIKTPQDELLPNTFFNAEQAKIWIDAHIKAEKERKDNHGK
jgi:hypothetical protein